jgi:protoheme IX farnesyltransferase
MKTLKPYLELCRAPLSLFAACSAATGFLIAPHGESAAVLVPIAAVFALACGASALNQVQERAIDARMERTKQRPIPAGVIAPAHALALSLILIVAGLFLLVRSGGMIAAGLGIAAILWYNGVYTFLKKKTAFAAVPGALVGAVPPAIGWVLGGGTLFDPMLSALCALLFLWQVPHFWLLVLRYGEDYERAGLPSLIRLLSRRQVARITFAWTAATAVAGLSLPLYRVVNAPLACFALFSAALWLIGDSTRLFRAKTQEAAYPSAFRCINGYIFFIMVLISADRFLLRIS